MGSYTAKEIKQQDRENTNQISLLQIGQVLKEERERKSLSIRDIRDITCIPTHHIVAIETGNRAELPEDFYLICFIKRYARAMGLTESILSGNYKKQKQSFSPSYEAGSFDILFKEDSEMNEPDVIDLKKRRGHKNSVPSERGFLKGYHFYFFIGVVLFVTAVYLVFQTLRTNSYNSMPATTFVIEDGKPIYIEKSKNTETVENIESEEEPVKNYEEITWDDEVKPQAVQKQPALKPKAQKISVSPVLESKEKQVQVKKNIVRPQPKQKLVVKSQPKTQVISKTIPKPTVEPVQKPLAKVISLPIQQEKNTELMLRPLRTLPVN